MNDFLRDPKATTAEHVLGVAAALLRSQGPAALTTRGVCDKAGITAPTLYHHFGDKPGLMRALAAHEVQAFFARKRSVHPSGDALADLMRGWDDWIAFARANPQLVAALRQGDAATADLRLAAEAIVLERLRRLPDSLPLRLAPATVACALVAGANTVVQLMLDGMAAHELAQVDRLLKQALVAALIGPADPP